MATDYFTQLGKGGMPTPPAPPAGGIPGGPKKIGMNAPKAPPVFDDMAGIERVTSPGLQYDGDYMPAGPSPATAGPLTMNPDRGPTPGYGTGSVFEGLADYAGVFNEPGSPQGPRYTGPPPRRRGGTPTDQG